MTRRIAMYFAWDRIAETGASLGELDNRFPALFEVRRLFWPGYETLAHAPGGQGIDGFLETIFLQNFARFGEEVAALTGQPLRQIQRRTAGGETPLDAALMDEIDTLIIISFDSQRTGQAAAETEISAVRAFLARPDAMLFVCPYHDVGDTEGLAPDTARERQVAEFRHRGDIALPGQQRFGGFGLSLMAGLGAPIRNRFGLRPAHRDDGDPAPFNQVAQDHFGILVGVCPISTGSGASGRGARRDVRRYTAGPPRGWARPAGGLRRNSMEFDRRRAPRAAGVLEECDRSLTVTQPINDQSGCIGNSAKMIRENTEKDQTTAMGRIVAIDRARTFVTLLKFAVLQFSFPVLEYFFPVNLHRELSEKSL